MRRPRYKHCMAVFCILIACILVCCFYHKQQVDSKQKPYSVPVAMKFSTKDEFRYSKKSDTSTRIKNYLVNIETCRIPDLDPYGPTVNKFIKVRKHHECPRWNLITYTNNFNIFVNRTVVRVHYRRFSKCSYRPYVKKLDSDDGMYFLRNKFQNFTKFIKVSDEFCMIICFDKIDVQLTEQNFAFVLRNEKLVKLRNAIRFINTGLKLKAKRSMNVVMIGLESTSRLNFIRHMNFTEHYLRNSLDAVELLGYNKAGLNTFPNLLMLLLGITWEEVNHPIEFYDEYPFIWKDFMEAGYVTLMGMDSEKTAIFHRHSKGFKRSPVDYYMRPFILELENTNYRDNLCSGNDLVFQSLLDKTADFVTVYHDVPHFTFTFISNPSHNDPKGLGIVDLPLMRTLTNLNTQGLLDDTVLFMFGDHGSRYGPMRSTLQGHIEENLPVFYISVPKWFRKEHRDLFENLKMNTNKLTSNVDVYATLHDILELGRGHKSPHVSGKYGTSFFRDISTNRTCDDLKIPDHFCACASFVETDSSDSVIVRSISKWLVNEINTFLICVQN